MTRNILHQLVDADDERAFFAEYWPSTPLIRHGALDRLEFAARVAEVASLGRLAGKWTGRIMAWPRAGSGLPTLEAMPDQAEALYGAGYTLFFSNVERQVPSVRAVATEFAAAMGIGHDDVSVEAFYSQRGSGAAPHFDPHAGFNVQLVGEKTWRLAPNQHIEFPLAGGVMGARPDVRVIDHARLPFPREMPGDSEVVTAGPGSVVFVPGGHWHTTHVTSDHSIAIVLTIRPRSWGQRLVSEVESRLHKQFAAARSASLANRADLLEANAATLDELLDALRDIVVAMTPHNLLRDWNRNAQPVLSVPPGVQVQVDESAGPEWALQIRQREKQFDAKIDRSLGTVLKAIVSRGPEISYSDLCRALPQRDPTELSRVVRELQQAGLVRAAAPSWVSA
jgi:ribosomal protein L16 Arg81 hydroxylase